MNGKTFLGQIEIYQSAMQKQKEEVKKRFNGVYFFLRNKKGSFF